MPLCGKNENISRHLCQGGIKKSSKQAIRGASNPRLVKTEVTGFGDSGRTVDEVFGGADECILAAFDEGIARVSGLLVEAVSVERGWRERVRAGLVALLGFLDEQPCWARFLILEPPVEALAVAERRQRALSALARALERETRGRRVGDGQFEASSGRSAPLTSSSLIAEMVVGGVVSVVQSQLLERTTNPLVELAPSLMAFILGLYQRNGRGVSEREHLPVRPTYRTTRVLEAVSAAPRSNNREIADAAGLRDQGQTSKLLSRLEQRGLVENVGLGAAYGEPNEWLLTAAGGRVLEAAPGLSAGDAGRPRGRRLVGGAA